MTSPWSPEDLRIDGTSLKTWGWGSISQSGLTVLPDRRGDNYTVGYGRGDQWQAKQLSSVQRTLNMWIDCRDPSTGIYPTSPAPYTRLQDRLKAQLNENIQAVMRLFAVEEHQVLVERDVLTSSGVETLIAYAETSGNAPVVYDPDSITEAAVSIDLVFTDPLWYGPETSASVGVGASPTVDNTGDVTARKMTLRFVGPLTNPDLFNDTNGTSAIRLSLGTSIAGGDWVDVDAGAGTVIRHSDGANLIGTLTNSGAIEWMPLYRGVNTLHLVAASGSGQVVITYRPPRI